MQAEGFGGVGGGLKLGMGLPLLVVEASDGAFECRHFFADFALAAADDARIGFGRLRASNVRWRRGGLAGAGGLFAFAVFDLLVDHVEVSFVVAAVVGRTAVADLDDASRDALHEMPVV